MLFAIICQDAGFTALEERSIDKESILRWSESKDAERSIRLSPYWSNIVGRDLDEKGLERIVNGNDPDENIAIQIATSFFQLLMERPPNVPALRNLACKKPWKDRCSFERPANIVCAIENPGVSTHVMHKGGKNQAQVKILPHVLDPWITETPQLFRNNGCLVYLTQRHLEGERYFVMSTG